MPRFLSYRTKPIDEARVADKVHVTHGMARGSSTASTQRRCGSCSGGVGARGVWGYRKLSEQQGMRETGRLPGKWGARFCVLLWAHPRVGPSGAPD
jgi:hypothetical protein